MSRQRFRRSLLRKDRGYNLNKPLPSVSSLFSAKVVVAPEEVSIYEFSDRGSDPYEDTVKFTDEIEDALSEGECVIDFRNTKRVSAAALVMLFAAIDSCAKPEGGRSSVIWSKVSPRVNRLLKRTRLVDKVQGKNFNYSFPEVKHLPIVSSSGNRFMEEILDHIQESVYKNKMNPETEYVYGDAVSETINNVSLHAYPSKEPPEKKWWLMCDVIGDQLYLAIYDRGVGIPKTVLEKPWLLDSMEKVYPDQYSEIVKEVPELEDRGIRIFVPRKLNDCQLIYLSMLGDVSGTKKDKHGQGSKSIRALVNETEGGKLWIYSNKGLYHFYNDETGPEIYKLPKKIRGTLVQWNIKLS